MINQLFFTQDFPVQLTDIIMPVVKTDSLAKQLTSFAKQLNSHLTDFEGNQGETATLYKEVGGEVQKYHLLGLGENPEFDAIIKTTKKFVYGHKKYLNTTLGLATSFLFHTDLLTAHVRDIDATLNGIILGTYEIGKFKSDAPKSYEISEIHIDCPESKLIREAAEKGIAMAKSQMSIMDMVNAPSNKLSPEMMGDWAMQSAKNYGYEVQVFNKEKIIKLGLHALLAVNQGSALPPAFIVAEYKPKELPKDNLPKVGLVGKGITFDTGGLSIKTQGMHYMKSDMGGAAAVLGTIEVAAKLQLPIHLIVIVPSSENSVDAKAMNPGDIIDSYLGKTIEVIDTDAEGRLVLADGLAYMNEHFQPDVLIDLATLTGSSVRALGYHAAALFTKNQELAQELAEAGERTGERVWQLPLWDIYQNDLKSDVADIKNFASIPVAGAITAAKFLENFVEKHPKWAHLDIAGVAFGNTSHASMKSGTGFGIRLLTDYMSSLANKSKEREHVSIL